MGLKESLVTLGVAVEGGGDSNIAWMSISNGQRWRMWKEPRWQYWMVVVMGADGFDWHHWTHGIVAGGWVVIVDGLGKEMVVLASNDLVNLK